MLLNVRLLLAYDGSDFIGWQDNGRGLSIEGLLQRAIERIQRHPITLQAASRTDSGVHASGQVVNFRTEFLKKPLGSLVLSLNSLLPEAIRVLEATLMAETFHPTLDVVGKEYHYHLCHGPVQHPLLRRTSWHYPYPLDYDAMSLAATYLMGTHDFAAFCYQLKDRLYPDTVRTLELVSVEPLGPQRLLLRFIGPHFLHKMVRILTGTLLFVGRSLLSPDSIPHLFLSRARHLAGVTAPPHGLTLHRILYSHS